MTRQVKRRPARAGGSADETREERAATWVFGPARVEETLQGIPNQVRRVLVRTGRLESRHQALLKIARARGAPLQRVPNQVLDRISEGARHQGAACEVSPVRWLALGDVLSLDPKPSRLLLLDRIEDPRNFGALVRAADGAGVDAVLVPRPRRGPPFARRHRGVGGGHRPRPAGSDPGRRERPAGAPGARVLDRGPHAAGEGPLVRLRLDQPTVLVVGSEGRGLAAGVSKECEVLVSLPQLGSVRSLNVSVAAGIVLYEGVRQRAGDRLPGHTDPSRVRS